MAETIYDLANLQQIQSGLSPLTNYATQQAEYQRALAGEAQKLFLQNHFATQLEGMRERAALQREQLSGDVALRRAKVLQDAYMERLKALDKEKSRGELEKFARQHGVAPKAGESDEDYEQRAHKEIRAQMEEGLGNLRQHITGNQQRLTQITLEAEKQREAQVTPAARTSALAMMPGVKSADIPALSKFSNEQLEAKYPGFTTQFMKERFNLLKEAGYPDSYLNERGILQNELKSSQGLYDDTLKDYRSVGGNALSALFPRQQTPFGPPLAPAGAGGLPMPPGAGAGVPPQASAPSESPALTRSDIGPLITSLLPDSVIKTFPKKDQDAVAELGARLIARRMGAAAEQPPVNPLEPQPSDYLGMEGMVPYSPPPPRPPQPGFVPPELQPATVPVAPAVPAAAPMRLTPAELQQIAQPGPGMFWQSLLNPPPAYQGPVYQQGR